MPILGDSARTTRVLTPACLCLQSSLPGPLGKPRNAAPFPSLLCPRLTFWHSLSPLLPPPRNQRYQLCFKTLSLSFSKSETTNLISPKKRRNSQPSSLGFPNPRIADGFPPSRTPWQTAVITLGLPERLFWSFRRPGQSSLPKFAALSSRFWPTLSP